MQVCDLIPADAPAVCTKRQLALWLGVNPITLRRWSNDKTFPNGLRLSERVTVYKTDEVREFIMRKLAQPQGRRGFSQKRIQE
jgi:predicted DNA-binding transcriptional regulator AlpA